MDQLLQSNAEKKAELDRLRGRAPGGLSNFEHSQDIELTYTSNAIEGNTLTAVETALVVEKGPPGGAGFRSLGETWADTTTPHWRLMLIVLGGLAEFEKELIPARAGEGRERAKPRGVKTDRKPELTPHQQKEALRRRYERAGAEDRQDPQRPQQHDSSLVT